MFFYKILYRLIYFIFKTQVSEIKGLENLPQNEGFIIAANHENSYDPMVMVVALKEFLWKNFLPQKKKLYFIGTTQLKKKIFQYSIISLAVNILGEKIGYLPATRAGIERAISLLEQGNIVVIFPEGKRNTISVLSKGKRGVAVLALLSGAKVIPTGCFGPPTWTIKQFLRGWLQKKKLIFGKRFSFRKRTRKQIDQRPFLLRVATDCIMERVAQTCGKKYSSPKLN